MNQEYKEDKFNAPKENIKIEVRKSQSKVLLSKANNLDLLKQNLLNEDLKPIAWFSKMERSFDKSNILTNFSKRQLINQESD